MHDEELNLRDNSLVSALILAYYSGEKLFHAIDSILRQSYRPLQLIVCDDGTEGFNTAAVREYIAARAVNIDFEVYHHTENLGTVRNLNTALARAKGRWIIGLAADDVFESDSVISTLVCQISGSAHRWLVVQAQSCDPRGRIVGQVCPSETDLVLLSGGDAHAIYYRLCRECFIPATGALYERELLNELGGADEHYQLVDDWPLFLKLIRQNCLPAISKEVCVRHRYGGVSTYRAGKNRRYQQDLIRIMEQEILPNLELLDADERSKVRKIIEEKKAVFQYRFCCQTAGEKLRWIVTHFNVVVRKLLRIG